MSQDFKYNYFYSYKGLYPIEWGEIPNRIRLSNGNTRTDKETFTEDELKDFTLLIENEDIENWTCSFEELEDMFLKMKNNKEFENNAPGQTPDYLDFINKEGKYTPIECSLDLDLEFARESE